MSEAAISVEGLTKIFPAPLRGQPLVAVRDVSLQVAPGEVYGLLGPNGSGKSTTLKVILGLVSPTEGRTRILGRDSRTVDSRVAVGFLPENPYFYKYLTGEETLRFFGRLCSLPRGTLEPRIGEMLTLVGLDHARDRRLATYSKGMLQRIGLAQALVNDPKVLVLDEPTAGVDPIGSRDIRDLILQLKARGITILLSSHLLAQAEEICDRVGILAHGRLVREGRLLDLITVGDRTEVVLENASDALIQEIEAAAARSNARFVARRKSTTSLENVFLDSTKEGSDAADAKPVRNTS
jgi:ABC-2 type transport system ATP-binding protein